LTKNSLMEVCRRSRGEGEGFFWVASCVTWMIQKTPSSQVFFFFCVKQNLYRRLLCADLLQESSVGLTSACFDL
jgi:hypothetical protein